ncbi:MAG: VCBS repeat-containing protein [Clostridium sp.]|nr:VCBS repeat-containing protein [Clostridium sp.]
MKHIFLTILFCFTIFFIIPIPAYAEETEDLKALSKAYESYRQRLLEVERREQIEDAGFQVIEEQIFSIEMRGFGEVFMIPAMEKEYCRLALFFADGDGNIVYKTDQLEANNRNKGELSQPVRELKAVSFQDLNGDRLTDIVMIVTCVNEKGDYAGKPYKIGEALFQGKGEFYRDYRLSDKINRFSMNKSVESIVSFVRDGYSTEFLYTAATKRELLDNGFEIIEEQCYYRQFEKLGRLEVAPGTYTMASFSTFMIYLINEQGYIVWSFQPMGDYENLYALKGITCRDIDGDGMKDILVLARYSSGGDDNELVVKSDYRIYYQRTGGFYEDTEIRRQYRCRDEDTVSELVERARGYWGWQYEGTY